MTRARIEVPSVESKSLGDGVGYVAISQFNGNTGAQFVSAYRKLIDGGANGIVLDLRDDPGGYLDQAILVGRALIPQGVIVQIEDKAGNRRSYSTIPHEPGPPLVVLVNGNTASAAEIVAGAVQDHGVGTLVGTHTYGKASVQSLHNLSGAGGLRLTEARYLTPSGRYIDKVGLTPDVQVPAPGAGVFPEMPALGSRNLAPGASGTEVKGLQLRLDSLGYNPGPADGVFGPRTAAALHGFQSDSGLAAGAADAETLQALSARIDAKRRTVVRERQLDRAVEILRQKTSSVSNGG